jgi:hypothetical protein
MTIDEQVQIGSGLIGQTILVPMGKYQRTATAWAEAKVVSYFTGGALTLVVEPVNGVGQARIREWAPMEAAGDLTRPPE